MDMLEANPRTLEPNEQDYTSYLDQQSSLLSRILNEVRRPNQRAVVIPSIPQIIRSGEQVKIQFLNQGLPVKSCYTIISVNCKSLIANVGINEPIMPGATDDVASGLQIPTGSFEIFENVEIENLYLTIIDTTAANFPVAINTAPTAQGSLWIYGWTYPSKGVLR